MPTTLDSTALAPTLRAAHRATPLIALARHLLLDKLANLQHGTLLLHDAQGTHAFGRHDDGLHVELHVHDPAFYAEAAFGGTLGAAESYLQGHWQASDLTTLVRLLVRNRPVLSAMDGGLGRLGMVVPRLLHALHRNTRRGSRRNIVAHYDLSDDFFRLFLDPTLCYSSAIWERPDQTLEEASVAKLDRICRKLRLTPTDHLLEIGSGWGALSLHAAGRYGCRVTTTTLSRNQYETTRARVAAAGLGGRITVLLDDYRDLRGSYSKLVSIEMIEAVGWQYYGTYFAQCNRLLQPDGQMLIQAIVIDDREYDRARREVDFIQRHVFPGSCIPSIGALTASVVRSTDLQPFHQEDLTAHYARTLREWRRAFLARLDEVRRLGFDDTFIRLWEYYLCYCEGGFAERAIGVTQLHYVKPQARPEPLLGAL
jgi:cyclopropane-fatty-acyl-phospholipid synthase